MKQRPAKIDEGSRAASILQPVLATKERKTVAVRDHTVKSGKVSVLVSPPLAPYRKWSGVAHAEGDILYLVATNLAAVHEWLVAKELGQVDEEGNFLSIGVIVDLVDEVPLEDAVISRSGEKLTITKTTVVASGFHVNVRLLNL